MFIKSIALASVITLGSFAAVNAAEVGVRHQSGSSWNSVTHGRASESYNGSSRTRTTSVGVNRAVGGAGHPNAGGGAGSLEVNTSSTRSRESFSGQSSNRFTGGSSSTFSGSSVFAN